MSDIVIPPRALTVITTYLHDDDRKAATGLGDDIYNFLTQRDGDSMGYGTSIPVYSAIAPDRVRKELANVVVVIPVLGTTAFFLHRKTIIQKLKEWHKIFGDGCLLVVPTCTQWRSMELDLPSKLILDELYGDGDRRSRTIQELLFAITRVVPRDDLDGGEIGTSNSNAPIDKSRNQPLFISHAKADLQYTTVANVIRDYISSQTTGTSFFDKNSLVPGVSLAEQLDKSASNGVFLAIRGDAYSSRSWCQRELLTAKKNGIPTLVVEVLNRGEKRSSPYSGNSPTIHWDSSQNPTTQASEIVSRCVVEWLKAAYFMKEAARVRELTGLPNDSAIIARPPELLDLRRGGFELKGS